MPYEEIIAAAVRLNVDIQYILTGVVAAIRQPASTISERLEAVKDATQIAIQANLPGDAGLLAQQAIFDQITQQNDYVKLRPDQKALLDNLENCSKEDQDAIRRMALLAASADNEAKPNKKAQMKKAG